MTKLCTISWERPQSKTAFYSSVSPEVGPFQSAFSCTKVQVRGRHRKMGRDLECGSETSVVIFQCWFKVTKTTAIFAHCCWCADLMSALGQKQYLNFALKLHILCLLLGFLLLLLQVLNQVSL